MSRQYTNLLIEAMENGSLDAEYLVNTFFRYLSEDQIKEFCLTANDREIAWELARFKGYGDQDFSEHEELESEWEYIKESEE